MKRKERKKKNRKDFCVCYFETGGGIQADCGLYPKGPQQLAKDKIKDPKNKKPKNHKWKRKIVYFSFLLPFEKFTGYINQEVAQRFKVASEAGGLANISDKGNKFEKTRIGTT